jgi:hypothetical protein
MMAERASRLLFALSLASMAGAASAQSDTPWNGGYLGLNLGEASTNACNSWTAGGTAFDIRNCPGSTFVGGVQREHVPHRHRLLVQLLGAVRRRPAQ